MINLFFVIHDHSGARTYANELLGYLSRQEEITVHKIYIESRHCKEYSIIKEDRITSIHIPKIRRQGDGIDKFAKRCVDIIAPVVSDKQNLIFHLNYATQVRFGMEAEKRFGAKLVYTMHYLPNYFTYLSFDDSMLDELTTTGDVLDKEILWEADNIVCISKFAQHAICGQYNIPFAKTEVIYNGFGTNENSLPEDTTQIKGSFGFENNERLILFAGGINAEKGVFGLVNAFLKIARAFPDTRLVLAGQGDDSSEAIKRCQGIDGRVTFTGNLPEEQLCKLYSIADIGVVPSHLELLGYVPMEMMRHRIPVIISDVPGMNELVEDGKSGLTCKVKKKTDGLLGMEVDSTDLYLKIKSLLENKHLTTRIAQNGRIKWENNFTAHHMGRATSHLYSQLLNQEKPGN